MTKGVYRVEEIFLATLSANQELFIDKYKDDIAKPQRVEDDDSIIK